jgi:hypothetical protein
MNIGEFIQSLRRYPREYEILVDDVTLVSPVLAAMTDSDGAVRSVMITTAQKEAVRKQIGLERAAKSPKLRSVKD